MWIEIKRKEFVNACKMLDVETMKKILDELQFNKTRCENVIDSYNKIFACASHAGKWPVDFYGKEEYEIMQEKQVNEKIKVRKSEELIDQIEAVISFLDKKG